MSEPGEVTCLLQRAEQGDRDASDALFRLVQKELRAIAARRKKAARGSDESVTGLVDEAFCRLVGQDLTTWQPGDRRKFFAYAAIKIHDLLVETARARSAKKRGGDRVRVEPEEDGGEAFAETPMADVELLVDLKLALDKFERLAPEDVILFRIRYYLGCTFEEIAEILSLSPTEVKRRFQKARLWLQRELKDYQNEN